MTVLPASVTSPANTPPFANDKLELVSVVAPLKSLVPIKLTVVSVSATVFENMLCPLIVRFAPEILMGTAKLTSPVNNAVESVNTSE